MQISKNAFLGLCTALYLGANTIILAGPVYNTAKMKSSIDKVKTELRDLDPKIYEETLIKAGKIGKKESELVLWQQALAECQHNQQEAASIATESYVKGTILK